MAKYDSGTVLWVYEENDPHNTEKERPVIVIRHNGRPYSSVECTVMCLGHGSQAEAHRTPQLQPGDHYTGISFSKDTYLLPWSIHTIPPAALNEMHGMGELTKEGRKLLAREFARML